jgi:kynureninase
MGTRSTARELDDRDELRNLRAHFAIPRDDDHPMTYLCGHSLGLMPRRARALVDRELERWAQKGVVGHFEPDGWLEYHRQFAAPLARLSGAHRSEVVAMNSLTVNLHLLLISFYRPGGRRSRIVIEEQAFPSDRYAVSSHLAMHGLSAQTHLLELCAADPKRGLQPADLEQLLQRYRNEVALVLLPGVQFLSGQVLDIEALTKVAHSHGCMIGFDLAHSIGNSDLRLHNWAPDFAVWCSYKYLNGGPGAIGGAFVHSRHHKPDVRPRLAGWWGHDVKRRFALEHEFAATPGAEGWQLSNPPIFSMAPLRASLELFTRAGLPQLRRKRDALNKFMCARVDALLGDAVELCTPQGSRAAQISLRVRASAARAEECAAELRARRIIVDTREPDIVRMAAVPLYNRFSDIERAVSALASIFG